AAVRGGGRVWIDVVKPHTVTASSGVARLASAAEPPVLAGAGAVTLDQQELAAAGIDEAFDLVSRAADVPDAIARGEALLEEVGREMGRALPALLRDSRAASSPLP